MSDFEKKTREFVETIGKARANGNHELADRLHDEMHLFIRSNPEPEKYKEPQDNNKENKTNTPTDNEQENQQEDQNTENKKGIYKTYWNNGNLKSEVVSSGAASIVKNFDENGNLLSTKLETAKSKLEKNENGDVKLETAKSKLQKNENGDVKLEVKDNQTLASESLKKIEELKEPLKQFCKDNNLDFEFINNCSKKIMDHSMKGGSFYDENEGHLISEDLKDVKDYAKATLSPDKQKEFNNIYDDFHPISLKIIGENQDNPIFAKAIEQNADAVRQDDVSKENNTDSRPKEEKTLDDMIASGNYTPEELDLALDIAIEDEKNREKEFFDKKITKYNETAVLKISTPEQYAIKEIAEKGSVKDLTEELNGKEQEANKKGIYKTYWNNGNLKSEVVSSGAASIVKNFDEDGKLLSTKLETAKSKLEKNGNGDVKLEVKDNQTLASESLKKIEDLKEPLKQFCKDNNLDFDFINNCDKKRMDYHLKGGKMYDSENGQPLAEDLKDIKDYGKNLSPEKKKEFDTIYRNYEVDTVEIIHSEENNPYFKKSIEQNAEIAKKEEATKQTSVDNRPKEEKALDEMIASGGYSVEELDLALDIGIEDEKNRLNNTKGNDKTKTSVASEKQTTTNKSNNIKPNILLNKKLKER